jgi:ABC-type transporter Mla subunit MlaD
MTNEPFDATAPEPVVSSEPLERGEPAARSEPVDRGEPADALREDIARTRADLAGTVEELAARTDIPARTTEAVSDLAAGAARTGREVAERVGEAAASLPGQLRSDVESVRDLVTGDGPDEPDLRPLLRLAAIAAVVVAIVVWLGRRRRG